MNLSRFLDREVAGRDVKAHGVYILKSPDYIFLVSMQVADPKINSVKVNIQPVPRVDSHFDYTLDFICLKITVNTRSMGLRGSTIQDTSYTHISDIGYDENCSVTSILKRKDGTKQMLLATLALCVQLFGVEKIQLVDASGFECEDEYIDLFLHNLLVYGKTWYERKHGAVAASHTQLLAQSKTALAGIVSESYANELIAMTHDDSIQTQIREAIDKKSWNQLFHDINEVGCSFFTGEVLESAETFFDIPNVTHWDVSKLLQLDLDSYLVSYKKIY